MMDKTDPPIGGDGNSASNLSAGDAGVEKIPWGICLNGLDDGIAIIQDEKIQYLNNTLALMVAVEAENLINSPWAKFIQSREIRKIFNASPVPTGESRVGTMTDATGAQLWIRFKVEAVTYGTAPAWLLVIRDLSDYRRMEEKLIKVKNLESIAALSGGIAHDYNNLLTVIMGNISLAQAYIDPKQDVYGLLEEAQKASEVARDLTEKLITFSRGGVPDTEIVSIAPLIRVAAEFTLSGSNLECEYAIAADVWPVEVDKKQISHVIYHLVMNAREAMPGGGKIRLIAENHEHRDQTRMLKPGRYVKITVCDQGPGIPEAIAEKIFDPYFSTKERGAQKGLGLGLSICYSIIHRHQGLIELESGEQRGSCFHIYLPAAAQGTADAETHKPVPVQGRLDRPVRILVMDDEEMILQLVGKIFQRMGHEVAFSRNGEEAIRLYQAALRSAQPFDIVILDLTVKNGMGGREAIQRLLEIDPQVRGIVSSGYSNDPVMMNYAQYGFVGGVTKPYHYKELGDKIAEIIATF